MSWRARGSQRFTLNIAKVASLSILIFGCFAQANATELLINGGFENEPNWGGGLGGNGGYTLLSGSDIPGWTIEPRHGVTVHNTAAYPTITGNYSVNMDGEGYNQLNADFYQDFATTSGSEYSLGYDYQGWMDSGPALLRVSVIDTVTNAILFDSSHGFSGPLVHKSGSFWGTGNAFRLRVQEAPESGYNDNKFMVDNFSVVETVPEPMSLLGLGVAGVLMARRRKTK